MKKTELYKTAIKNVIAASAGDIDETTFETLALLFDNYDTAKYSEESVEEDGV